MKNRSGFTIPLRISLAAGAALMSTLGVMHAPTAEAAATRTDAKVYLSDTPWYMPGTQPGSSDIRVIKKVWVGKNLSDPASSDVAINAGSATPIDDWITAHSGNPAESGYYTLFVLLNRSPMTIDGKSYAAGKVLLGTSDNIGTEGGWNTWRGAVTGFTKGEAAEGDSDNWANAMLKASYVADISADSVLQAYREGRAGTTSLV